MAALPHRQIANRKYRRIVKQKLNSEESVLPKIREVSNIRTFEKDGKIYNPDMSEKELRK